ncbi:MAG: tryptophan synthase subunit alpha [Candidatus Methanomethylicia archaeon]
MDLEEKLQELKKRKEGGHIAHIYYGDPNEEFSIKLIETLTSNGVDIVEFGIPFSDPIADGEVFRAACERALKAGITPNRCIEGIKKLRDLGLEMPIIVTTYFNIPYVMGFNNFLDKIKRTGAQGILIPDLPIEEAKPFLNIIRGRNLNLILQVSPTTSRERLRKIVAEASGFIYIIGIKGVTGSKIRSWKTITNLIRNVKKEAEIPVMVGFGVSRGEHAETIVSAGADGVVVGSAYAKVYSENLNNPFQKLPEIAKLSSEIKIGCINGYRNRKH